MNISVFGLGHLGAVSAACLARDGHRVIGVDVGDRHMQQIAEGRPPVFEPGLDALLAAGSIRLWITSNVHEAVTASEVSLICVSTSNGGGVAFDPWRLEHVCREIGAALAGKSEYHVVVVRSSVVPGTVRGRLVPILEATSGKAAGADFGVAMNPAFLREGTAIDDYYHPGQVVIGELDRPSGGTVEVLYETVDAARVRTSIEAAEMIRYVDGLSPKAGRFGESGNVAASRVRDCEVPTVVLVNQVETTSRQRARAVIPGDLS